MASRTSSRLTALLLALLLALVAAACDDSEDAEEDPQQALEEGFEAFRDYEGVELVLGMQLDDTAQSHMRDDEDMGEAELELLLNSSLTMRATAGDGEDEGDGEFVLNVGGEDVFELRALAETQLYVLLDLSAMERVADDLDAGDEFRAGISEFQQMAGFMGLGDVLQAAQDGDWIQITGVEQMMDMAGGMAGQDEPSEEDMEQMAREIGERLLTFVRGDGVDVSHIGSDDAGDRVRVTAGGPELRDLLLDIVTTVEDLAADADPTGMGMPPGELRRELEQEIPDDIEFSFDVWLDGGEISQLGLDVFELARSAEAEDAPDGEFLVLVGIADFTGSIDAPDDPVTFDLFELFGGMMGGLGGDPFGDDPFDDEMGGFEDDGVEDLGEPPAMDDDFCLSEDEIDQILQQMPEEERDLTDEELEQMLGVPVC